MTQIKGYLTRVFALARILDMHPVLMLTEINTWYHSMQHLITWRETLDLCLCRAALGDPMPWEGTNDKSS